MVEAAFIVPLCDRYPKNKPLADQKEKSLALSSRCFRAEVHQCQNDHKFATFGA